MSCNKSIIFIKNAVSLVWENLAWLVIKYSNFDENVLATLEAI